MPAPPQTLQIFPAASEESSSNSCRNSDICPVKEFSDVFRCPWRDIKCLQFNSILAGQRARRERSLGRKFFKNFNDVHSQNKIKILE
jgi:hypothetical protein